MFYLTTHSTHVIYGYVASHMVKDHSDNEKGNPLPPHRLLFPINSKDYFICTIPQTGLCASEIQNVMATTLTTKQLQGSGLILRNGISYEQIGFV